MGSNGSNPNTAPSLSGQSHEAHWFLSKAEIESFGAFGQRSIGPFTDGLNVVYGENEAGKSTLAAFITGVLFGWIPARGKRNTYRPQGGERAGRLVFSNAAGDSAQVSRRRNAEGLQGDSWLVGDIEADEYERLFALNADELRSLDKGPALVSRLLTAGAGTVTSPSVVRQQLAEELKGYFSHRASRPDSLVYLQSEMTQAGEAVAREQAKADELRQLHARHEALQQQKEHLSQRLQQQNMVVEHLKTQTSLVASLEQQRDDLLVQEQAMDQCASKSDDDGAGSVSVASLPKHRMDDANEDDGSRVEANAKADALTSSRARATVDRLYEEQIRLEQNVKAAKDNLDNALQRHASLQQDDVFLEAAAKEKRTRKVQSIVSVLLPLVILLIGVPVFVYGQSLGSMTVTAFGVALIAAGVLAAIAALVALVRPNQSDDLVAQRRADAQWVVDKDRERVRACEKALQDHQTHCRSVLQSLGLGMFESVTAAREAMNRAYDDRAPASIPQNDAETNRARAIELWESVHKIQAQIDGVLADAGASDIVALDEMTTRMVEQRDALQQDSDRCNNRLGQLAQQLQAAKNDDGLLQAQQHLQDLKTQFEDSERSYARDLLAYRSLSEALDSWQENTQPLVYRQASDLFSAMTGGAWSAVRPRGDVAIEVVAANGAVFSPDLLSLGTCQQLYLALRTALLLVADDVGRNVPVLADDILVNFDDARRMAAVQALLRLSAQRQVILFTGQQQLVYELQQAAPSINVVTLARTRRSL